MAGDVGAAGAGGAGGVGAAEAGGGGGAGGVGELAGGDSGAAGGGVWGSEDTFSELFFMVPTSASGGLSPLRRSTMMRTLATPYVFWILLCSSSLWRRAGGATYRSIFRRTGPDRTEGLFSHVHVYSTCLLFIVAAGISCTLMCAFLYLLLAYVIDSLSRRDARARSERVKRSRIPKIVLERAQTEQSHFDDDNDEDEEEEDETDDDSTRKMQPYRLSRIEYEGERSAFDKRISIARSAQSEKASLPIMASPSHLPISGLELANGNLYKETKEEYLKWLKSIHMILQITYAVQPHLQGRRNEESINIKDISVNSCHERG